MTRRVRWERREDGAWVPRDWSGIEIRRERGRWLVYVLGAHKAHSLRLADAKAYAEGWCK